MPEVQHSSLNTAGKLDCSSTKRIQQLLVKTAHMYTTSAKDCGLLEGHLGHVAIQTMDRNTQLPFPQ